MLVTQVIHSFDKKHKFRETSIASDAHKNYALCKNFGILKLCSAKIF